MNISNELLITLLPLIAFELFLMLYALRDWLKQPKDMPDRMIWLLLILFVQIIGPAIYFLFAVRVSNEEEWLLEEET